MQLFNSPLSEAFKQEVVSILEVRKALIHINDLSFRRSFVVVPIAQICGLLFWSRFRVFVIYFSSFCFFKQKQNLQQIAMHITPNTTPTAIKITKRLSSYSSSWVGVVLYFLKPVYNKEQNSDLKSVINLNKIILEID